MADAVIPRFRAERAVVPGTYDPDRRPGSSGQRYFSDVEYANPNMPQRIFDKEAEGYETQAAYDARYDRSMDAAIDKARATNTAQVAGLQALNLANPARQQRPATFLTPAEAPAGIATVTPNQTTGTERIYDLLAQYIQGSQLQPYGTGNNAEAITTEGASYTFPTEIQRGVGMIGVGNAVEQIGYRNPKDYFEMGLTPEDIVNRGLGGFTSEQPGNKPYDLLVGEYKNYLDVQEAHRAGSEYARRIMQEPGEYPFSVTDDPNYFRPAVTFGLFDQGLTPEQLMQAGGAFEYIYPGSAGEGGLRQAYEYWQRQSNKMAQGGLATLAQGGNIQGPGQQYLGGRGFYLGGPTDGMADQIPATIDNRQPAALSDGEFVIPADVVSHLGNGNSEAGAQNLYSMMDRVRTDRTGNPEQGRQIDPNKYLA
jgi:hypothetical protein